MNAMNEIRNEVKSGNTLSGALYKRANEKTANALEAYKSRFGWHHSFEYLTGEKGTFDGIKDQLDMISSNQDFNGRRLHFLMDALGIFLHNGLHSHGAYSVSNDSAIRNIYDKIRQRTINVYEILEKAGVRPRQMPKDNLSNSVKSELKPKLQFLLKDVSEFMESYESKILKLPKRENLVVA